MAGIERDNPALKGVLPKDYARPALDKERLGQLIDLISNIKVGDEASRTKDVLGRVYEYFLSQFASAEGKKGGEFYTPRSVVKLLVEMIEPYRGRVYDPCCGSSGMFVQSIEFIRAHAKGNGNGGKAKADISIYGQESNYTTWRLAANSNPGKTVVPNSAHFPPLTSRVPCHIPAGAVAWTCWPWRTSLPKMTVLAWPVSES
jgi:type I restriction enzyme M protein